MLVVMTGILQLALFASGPQDMQRLADHVAGKIPAILLQIEGPVQVAVVPSVMATTKAPDDSPEADLWCGAVTGLARRIATRTAHHHAAVHRASQGPDRPCARAPPVA